MLSKIIYNKLFGIFDYEIELKEHGVTIITGPNGFGKSTILKSINALYSFDIFFFSELDFDKIEFYSSDFEKEPICIKKQNDNLFIDNYKIDIEFINEEIYRRIRRPYLLRLDNERLINRHTEEIIYKKDLIKSNLSENLKEDVLELINNTELMKKLKDFSGITKFIKEQRLLKVDNEFRGEFRGGYRGESQVINVIEELPQKFKEKINEVSTRYSDVANKLDSTYPNRLFKTKKGITKDEYKKRIQLINEKFTKLKKYSIYDVQELEVSKNIFDNELSIALKIYLDDFEMKYKVFDEFIEELDLFTDIINNRLRFKEIKISRKEGIVVYKKDTDETLRLDQLSSGEKQEIILFYELIFESEKSNHLLIDEPEISLHIEWQLNFLNDLLKIVDKKQFKVTVATHSPQIISNHWDIQVDLGELLGEKYGN
mgnify:CR=1 FL=1